MAKAKFKPLSFTTTLRNPERIPLFLKCLLPYEGEILTKEVIRKIAKNIIKEKLYCPMGVKRSSVLKSIWENDERKYSDIQLEQILIDNPQNHKEAGFDKGWDSRFDIPISRHLKAAIKERRAESFAVLIAPIIHSDTIEACDWQKYKNNIDIIPYSIEEFIKEVSKYNKSSDLLNKR